MNLRLPLYQKDRPRSTPITAESIALFRLGEQCDNACPMCSNSGRPEAFFIPTDELLRRADHLSQSGFRAVFVTGGEPTIHPAFWQVVSRLRQHGMTWHLNTHGRRFSDGDFTRRAIDSGLGLTIVSLHSHVPIKSAEIFGAGERSHEETVRGIGELRKAGARILVNCVLSTVNLPELPDYIRFIGSNFGPISVKLAFPFHLGKGGKWPALYFPLKSLRAPLVEARQAAIDSGVDLQYESIPNCISGDPLHINRSRSGCGESHYLDDIDGKTLHSIEYLEADHSHYAKECLQCTAFQRCPGVGPLYADRFGTTDLIPFK